MTRWQLFSLQCTWTSSCGWLTAHGLAGVDLLSHEELLQLPDVHPGLCHVLWVPALRRTAILGGVITCREGRREMRIKGERTKKPVWARPSAERESFLSHLTCWYLNTKWGEEALQSEGSENTARGIKNVHIRAHDSPSSSSPVCVCCDTSGDKRPTRLFQIKYLTFLVYSSINETPDVVGDPSVFQGEYSNSSMFLTKHFKSFQGCLNPVDEQKRPQNYTNMVKYIRWRSRKRNSYKRYWANKS